MRSKSQARARKLRQYFPVLFNHWTLFLSWWTSTSNCLIAKVWILKLWGALATMTGCFATQPLLKTLLERKDAPETKSRLFGNLNEYVLSPDSRAYPWAHKPIPWELSWGLVPWQAIMITALYFLDWPHSEEWYDDAVINLRRISFRVLIIHLKTEVFHRSEHPAG